MLRPGTVPRGNAHLDESLFNTYDSTWGAPRVLEGAGHFALTEDAVEAGPGTHINLGELERGFNAWYGASGYYVDAPGVDRVVDVGEEIVYQAPTRPTIGANPWDTMFGRVGSEGVYQGTEGVGVLDWPSQAGDYSNS